MANPANLKSELCCITNTKIRKCSLTWTIDKYFVHYNDSNVLKSSEFSAPDDGLVWYLEHSFHQPKPVNTVMSSNSTLPSYLSYVTSFFNSNSPTEYLSLKLYVYGSGLKSTASIKGEVRISVVVARNKKVRQKQANFAVEIKNSPYSFFVIGFDQFLKKSDLTGFISFENRLTLCCELAFSKAHEITHDTFALDVVPVETAERGLSRDFEQLFKHSNFSDVTISVKKETYSAHKCILATRSSVFNAMFSHEMQEKLSNHVTITDMEPKVFHELLRYMYTGKAHYLKTIALDLFVAAEKYDLKALKDLCEDSMHKNLTKDNVVEILIFAHLHQAERLKERTLQFIKIHFRSTNNMANLNGWKTLISSQPSLLDDILAILLE